MIPAEYSREERLASGAWRTAAWHPQMGQIAVSDYDGDGEYIGTTFVDTPEEADALFDGAALPGPVQAYVYVN